MAHITNRGFRFRLGRLALAWFGVAAALALWVSAAEADVIPSGKKYVRPTFEIANIAEHDRYLIVAFPFGACFPPGEEFFRLNPQHDRAEHNYEVLRPGRRYAVQKFCFNMEIYAFERNHFSVRTETLEQDLDWYRKKGDQLTIVEPFDHLRTTEKIAFVSSDPRVRRSGFRIAFPLLVDATNPVTATHDVLRIAELTPKSMQVVGQELVLSLPSGKAVTRPYRQGKRPSDRVTPEQAKQAPPEPPSPKPHAAAEHEPPSRVAAAGSLTVPPAPRPVGLYLALGFGGVAGLGGIVAVSRRRRRPEQREPRR